jgi:hypothetical protein
MKRSVKMAMATGALAIAGGLFIAGSGVAQSAGPMGGHRGGPMAGPMGGPFGELRREMLKGIDTNGDGALSQDEINAAVNARFAEFDADKNGSLSLQEFEALWADLTRPMTVRAFQFLDPNGDAEVSKEELDDRFANIVKEHDRNHDGLLSSADRMGHGRHGPRHHMGPRGDGPSPSQWRHHGWWWGGPQGGPQDDGPEGQAPQGSPDAPADQ